VITRALGAAIEAVNRGDSDIIWLSTGPGLLTRALAGVVANSTRGLSEWPGDIVVLGRTELYRVAVPHCIAAYKMTAGHWSQTAFGQRAGQGRVGVTGWGKPGSAAGL